MITLSINESDKHVLRVTASYLLALAGDISTEITGADVQIKIPVDTTNVATFNTTELDEAALFAAGMLVAPPPPIASPSAAEVFGGKSDAPSIVVANQSTTAPVDTTATTLVPTPPTAPTPPAPPVENAASPAVPASPNPASGVELDARGLPWDSRIHSREKTKIANGNWKNKRGALDETIAAVEAELKGVMAIPATVAVPAPPAPTTQVTETPAFPAFMQRVMGLITVTKELTQEELGTVLKANGVDSLPLLAKRPDLIPAIEEGISFLIAAKGGA